MSDDDKFILLLCVVMAMLCVLGYTLAYAYMYPSYVYVHTLCILCVHTPPGTPLLV